MGRLFEPPFFFTDLFQIEFWLKVPSFSGATTIVMTNFLIRFFLTLQLTLIGLGVATLPVYAQGFGPVEMTRLPAPKDGPMQVGVGMRVDQITFVDQQAENFGVVGTLMLRADFPELAFSPEPGELPYRSYTPEAFSEIARTGGALLPSFIIRNQQGRRFVQQSVVVLQSTGTVTLVERFTATLQAPYFNFRQYPFDNQMFFVEISSLLPAAFVEFSAIKDQSGLGDTLGEEEWVLFNPKMEVSVVEGFTGLETSQIALSFQAKRHVIFYVLRILLPLLIILLVSWATFFLQEYRRRIDMASANLLVFVAFNFAISTTLPRLGYLTFLDSLLVGMFVITGSMVLVNIALRRLKLNDRENLAHTIDRYLVVWIYPAIHAGFLFWAVKFYLL